MNGKRRRGRASFPLLASAAAIVIALAIVGSRFLAARMPAPPSRAHAHEPVPPVLSASQLPHVRQATARASVADEARPIRPTSAGLRLQLELVDELGQPLEGEFDVEDRVTRPRHPHGGWPTTSVNGLRGPRIELPVGTPGSTWFTHAHVVVRRLGLRGETEAALATDAADAWTTVTLHPTTLVRGRIVDAWDQPVGGVDVLVRGDASGNEPHSRARTDASGAFVVDALRTMRNRLFVGDLTYPWVAPMDVEATATELTLEPVRLQLCAATFQLLRADGFPAAGAALDGIAVGTGRGNFATATDRDGRARVTTLQRGRWRVNAFDATHGRASRTIEFPLAEDEPVLILLPR